MEATKKTTNVMANAWQQLDQDTRVTNSGWEIQSDKGWGTTGYYNGEAIFTVRGSLDMAEKMADALTAEMVR